MKRIHTVVFLAAISIYGAPVPAAAAASAHPTASPNTLELGSAAKHIKQEEAEERERRRAAYTTWFYRKNGYAPNQEQFREWHYRAYGVYPS